MTIKVDKVVLGAKALRFNEKEYPLTSLAIQLVEERKLEINTITEVLYKEVEEAIQKAKTNLEICNKKFEATLSLEVH